MLQPEPLKGILVITPGTRMGDYEITGIISTEGAHSTVYKADSCTTGETVAIKTARIPMGDPNVIAKDKSYNEEFLDREQDALDALDGSNNVALLDSGLENLDAPIYRRKFRVKYSVMPYITHPTLEQYLKETLKKKIDNVEEFFLLAIKIGYAIFRIHQRNIIHGDIRPENIFCLNPAPASISHDGFHPIFFDFGQSGYLNQKHFDRTEWKSNHTFFDPQSLYCDALGDIYSFGQILVWLLTGADPEVWNHQCIAKGKRLKWDEKKAKEYGEIRNDVASFLTKHGCSLHRRHPGILNIVVRCLRSRAMRFRRINDVLESLQTFAPPNLSPLWDVGITEFKMLLDSLSNVPETVFDNRSVLIDQARHFDRAMASDVDSAPSFGLARDFDSELGFLMQMRMNQLYYQLKWISNDIWEFQGSRDYIVNIYAKIFAHMGEGDYYDSCSTHGFWGAKAAGTKGRFMAANMLAVCNGAEVRRIHLLRAIDLNREEVIRHLKDIVNVEQTLGEEFGVDKARRFQNRVLVVDMNEWYRYVEQVGYFAELRLKGKTFLMRPLFDGEMHLNGLQIRPSPLGTQQVQECFKVYFEHDKATELSTFLAGL